MPFSTHDLKQLLENQRLNVDINGKPFYGDGYYYPADGSKGIFIQLKDDKEHDFMQFLDAYGLYNDWSCFDSTTRDHRGLIQLHFTEAGYEKLKGLAGIGQSQRQTTTQIVPQQGQNYAQGHAQQTQYYGQGYQGGGAQQGQYYGQGHQGGGAQQGQYYSQGYQSGYAQQSQYYGQGYQDVQQGHQGYYSQWSQIQAPSVLSEVTGMLKREPSSGIESVYNDGSDRVNKCMIDGNSTIIYFNQFGKIGKDQMDLEGEIAAKLDLYRKEFLENNVSIKQEMIGYGSRTSSIIVDTKEFLSYLRNKGVSIEQFHQKHQSVCEYVLATSTDDSKSSTVSETQSNLQQQVQSSGMLTTAASTASPKTNFSIERINLIEQERQQTRTTVKYW